MTDNNLTLIAQVKTIKVNEGMPIFPVDLTAYLENPDQQALSFSASLSSGEALPEGLSLSAEGVFSGRPKEGAALQSPYSITVLVKAGNEKLTINFDLNVYVPKTPEEIAQERAAAWKRIAKDGFSDSDLNEIIHRPISKEEIYYLLERYASFTLWNADDLRLAEKGKQVAIANSSDKYQVYDFEVCLVATPKDLFAHDRTVGDAIKTAKAMVQEAHKREWHVELGGFDRMADAAWYEAYDLNKASSFQMEVRGYEPAEMKIAMAAASASSST